MFDHVKFGVGDYAASKALFLKALAPLGITVVSAGPPSVAELLTDPSSRSAKGLPMTSNLEPHPHAT